MWLKKLRVCSLLSCILNLKFLTMLPQGYGFVAVISSFIIVQEYYYCNTQSILSLCGSDSSSYPEN